MFTLKTLLCNAFVVYQMDEVDKQYWSVDSFVDLHTYRDRINDTETFPDSFDFSTEVFRYADIIALRDEKDEIGMQIKKGRN